MTEDRFLVCDERDWEGLSAEQRDWMIFKTLRSMSDEMQTLKRWNKLFSAVGGMIGGAAAFLGIKFFG